MSDSTKVKRPVNEFTEKKLLYQRERYEQGETDHRNFLRFCATSGGRMGERGKAPGRPGIQGGMGKEESLSAKLSESGGEAS